MRDGAGSGPDGFVSSLRRLVADGAAGQAASERSRTRVLRQVAEDEATFAGLALDLCERGETVVATTTAGRPHRGRIVAVGRDFVVLRAVGRPPVVLASAAVSSVRPEPGRGGYPPGGDRATPLEAGMAAVLAGLAAARPRVQVAGPGAAPLTGQLRAVGRDVATLVLDGGHRQLAFVPLSGVAEVVLLDEAG